MVQKINNLDFEQNSGFNNDERCGRYKTDNEIKYNIAQLMLSLSHYSDVCILLKETIKFTWAWKDAPGTQEEER